MGIIICVVAMAIAAMTVAIAVDRAGQRSLRRAEMELRQSAELEAGRRRAAAQSEERAANFYALKVSLETVQQQAQMQGTTAAAATAALAKVADVMGQNDRAALEALETRAIVDAYTQMLLRQQKKERPRIASSRPWL